MSSKVNLTVTDSGALLKVIKNYPPATVFSLEPSVLIGRFKLSQSKSLEDQKRIIKELSLRKDENSKLITKFMTENIQQ